MLESTKVETDQNTARKQASKGHSLPGEGRGHNWLEHKEKEEHLLAGKGSGQE